jgi:hypothetical protein
LISIGCNTLLVETIVGVAPFFAAAFASAIMSISTIVKLRELLQLTAQGLDNVPNASENSKFVEMPCCSRDSKPRLEIFPSRCPKHFSIGQ